jgi:hypothetical protein
MLILKFRERNHELPELIRCGRFPSKYYAFSSSLFLVPKGNLTSHRNRLFIQARSQGGFVFPSDTILFERGIDDYSLGLAILDYNLNTIKGFDIDSHSPNSKSGPITITDSVLYITNHISDARARFGEILFQEDLSKHYAVVAKYVDTAFMTPYTTPTIVSNIQTKKDINVISVFPNPTISQLNINLSEQILSIKTVSMLGQHTTLNHNGTSVDVSPLAPGIYIMEIHTSKNDYKCKFIKY